MHCPFIRLVCLAACIITAQAAQPLPAATPASTPSEAQPLVTSSLLLDVSRVDGKIVAVGERGHLIISRDEGKTWKQIITPTRATLTAVDFDDQGHGWAVGHQGVIIDTENEGESWSLITRPDQSIIYLDTLRIDDQKAIAIGAYGTYDWTEDAGNSIATEFVSEMEMHLNHITRTQRGWFIVGESGEMLRSDDEGATWDPVKSPYVGSLYGLLELPDQSLLLFGLRGRIFRLPPNKDEWVQVPNDTEILITDGIILEDGTIILSGMGDHLFISRDNAQSFQVQRIDGLEGTTSLIGTKDDAIICVGRHGVLRIECDTLIPDSTSADANH